MGRTWRAWSSPANPMRDNVAYVNSIGIHKVLSRNASAKPTTVLSPTFGLPW
jgi:hypothetical protein